MPNAKVSFWVVELRNNVNWLFFVMKQLLLVAIYSIFVGLKNVNI